MLYKGAGILFIKQTSEGTFISLGKRKYSPDKGIWSIPGGGMEEIDGGDFLKTAIRETNEEYFGRTKALSYTRLKDKNLKFYDSNIPLIFIFRTYLYKVKEIRPFKVSEFSEVSWFNINDLPNQTHPEILKGLKKFPFLKRR